jgi:glycine oxidase
MGANSRNPDGVVIGGGLIGCSIALRLAQAGLRVTVLERSAPGAEASSAAAGMLSPQSEGIEPGPFFELCMASRRMYPKFTREVEALSGLKVDYRRDGTLLVATCARERRELEELVRAHQAMGLSLTALRGKALRSVVPGLSRGIDRGLFLAGDHSVDNEKLSAAAAVACARLGVRIISGATVTRLVEKSGRIARAEWRNERGVTKRISAGTFVIAAGCWSAAVVRPLGIDLPMRPCHGQMMEFEAPRPLPLVVRAGHTYLVPRSENRIVVGTTSEYAGFEKKVTAAGLNSLLTGALRILPEMQDSKFLRAWAGLRPDTADHLPILGRGRIPNLIFATGHFRNGILLAPITAQIVRDLVERDASSVPIESYRPTRFD